MKEVSKEDLLKVLREADDSTLVTIRITDDEEEDEDRREGAE